ncbi:MULTISPECIES: C40 family peptidase [Paenibacillus]|uniref:C40 family peptidase n=1 Tax=Paenibacillus TaxID=44249 RepID=UPI0022B938ED|nr:NlpC/P60 family protein [Paenibacillus caseinilyticus]MCZ8521124.1 NlpC/P60 family protein [Paenibacillus caseinilyticus]
MTERKRLVTAVNVATVWTSPQSTRPVDEAALGAPADTAGWTRSLTPEERLDLYASNRVQTQLLYGTPVEVCEEHGGWSKVLIADQRTSKEPLGYPGWVPSRQLAPLDGTFEPAGEDGAFAVVTAPRTILSFASTGECIELSYLTKLPVLSIHATRVGVLTPHGPGIVLRGDVRLSNSGGGGEAAAGVGIGGRDAGLHTGEAIVREGLRFAGLPYLWGGMSSYGYDCSGFAHSMHRALDILIPRDASDQAREGRLVEPSELEPGDLLFFAHDGGEGRIHHVGIYAGEGRMLHSPDSASRIGLVDLASYRLADEHCISRRYWGQL